MNPLDLMLGVPGPFRSKPAWDEAAWSRETKKKPKF